MTTPERAPLPVPGPDPASEAARRKALKQHKAMATGLLIFAAVIYIACEWYESTGNAGTWVGFVRAASEAGMVGGLADWFAVTALFRYPLGLKIPHTAIIRRKKDQVGEALSEFVGENFLNSELITEKVSSAHIPERLSSWMMVKSNAEKVSREAGKLIANSVRALDPKDAEAVISTMIIDKIAQPEWAPPLGKIIEQLNNEGHTDKLIDELVQWGYKKAQNSEDLIVRILDERAPSWAPKFVNNLVGDKVYKELVQWAGQVANDPNHEARQAIRRFITTLAEDLQHDPVMIARVEEFKHDVMNSRAVQDSAKSIWVSTSNALVDAALDPESVLRKKLVELTMSWGTKLHDDKDLRESVDRRITTMAAFLADNYAGEITGIISDTIERWDADEASDKIELMVGKDLQYIRLNGTVVGALAGLAIYTVSYLIFGA